MNIKNTVYTFPNRIIASFWYYIPIVIHVINTHFSSLRTLHSESQATGTPTLQNKVGMGTRSVWEVTHLAGLVSSDVSKAYSAFTFTLTCYRGPRRPLNA